ncbi:3-deoxy-manno-octulosonate cytidylyltransferase [Aeoliella sp. SH292]|uniref:3-deoxy-manno-octulosonate cytidylyltransferase n=1 Tax=Aeoliella sp. SH292 TaxID=3454464 RepID=UPI003F9B680A
MNNTRALRSYVVVPARLGSTRLRRKMLLSDTGRSLIEHTYEAARRARRPVGVVVATDSVEIAEVIRRTGGTAVMTSESCASGTDRVAEVAAGLPDADVLVNLQGDEPEMAATAIDQVIELLEQNPHAPMATLATPLRDAAQIANPACVKVVFDDAGRAMYFSRSQIPFVREAEDFDLTSEPALFHQHLGIYAYRRDFLMQLASWPPSRMEQAERLEQLRVIERGHAIMVGVTQHTSSGIDTAEDYAKFVSRWQRAA